MKKNRIKLALKILIFILSVFPPMQAKADVMDYLSGCITGMGAGMAGTAFANSRLEDNKRINTTGYAISGGISCLAGMGFVAIVGSQAEFNATWRLKKENENLTFQKIRLSKERCLLKNTCTPGGRAIIVDTDVEIKKQGDKVFETSTSTIETND